MNQRQADRIKNLRPSDVVTLDFETHAIQPRPDYPPTPVGLAIKINNNKAQYLAWAHPTGNNSTKLMARSTLDYIYESGCTLIFHNAKFDLDVANETFSCSVGRAWSRLHDTMLMAFLINPNSEVLSLKPLADKHLDMAPQEQTDLMEWVLANVAGARRAPTKWGAHISKAPVRLVEPYAKGDVDRTYALYKKWQPEIIERGMEAAYRRELKCIPMLLDMEMHGIPIDTKGLRRAVEASEMMLDKNDEALAKKLGISVADLGKKEIFADALEGADALDEWILTPTGKRSTSVANLKQVMTNQRMLNQIEYRGIGHHQVNTFGHPWLQVAEEYDHIYPSWNQVRQSSERAIGRAVGARTGRLSSSPNVQNIPAVLNPNYPMIDLRKYVAAPVHGRLTVLDYEQQELRIMAHYAGGDLLKLYQDDPNLDQHQLATTLINELLGTSFSRNQVKTVGFGILYAMGLDLLAESIDTDRGTAGIVRNAYKEVFPGIKTLDDDCKRRGREGECIRTWGGREYFVEPPDKYGRTFEYKMLNRLIQGSAADVLKEAMTRYYYDPNRTGRLVMSVHDEIMAMHLTTDSIEERNRLQRHMESVEFDLSMPTSGGSAKTWRGCK